MSEWSQYRKKSFQEMRAYVPGEALPIYVSVSVADKTGGSPKLGDMVARNPGNHADQRLVAEDFFHDNYEPVPAPGSVTITAKSLDEIIEAERERDDLREEVERLRHGAAGWERTARACSDAAAQHLAEIERLRAENKRALDNLLWLARVAQENAHERYAKLTAQRDALADALEAVDWTNQRAAVQVKIGDALRLAGYLQKEES